MADGDFKWSFTTGGFICLSSPCVSSDGTIFIGCLNNVLYAIKPDGTQKWAYTAGGQIYSSPCLNEDESVVYFGGSDNKVYAINASDGSEKWTRSVGNEIRSSASVDKNGIIYIGCHDFNLYALNPSDGSVKWTFPTGGIVYSTPAIDQNNIIYVGSNSGHLFAVNTDGTQKWDYNIGEYSRSSPAIDDTRNMIYISSRYYKLHAVNIGDGSSNWVRTFNNWSGAVYECSPAIDSNGVIYVTGDTYAYAINPNNTEKWKFLTFEQDAVSSFIVDENNLVYFGNTSDHEIHCVNQSGNEVWSYDTGDDIESTPAINNDGTEIYIPSWNNKITALKVSNKPLYTPNDYFDGTMSRYFTMARNQPPITGYTIIGNVKDHKGNNIQGASVSFVNTTSYLIQTDANGNYSQKADIDIYNVTVSKTGYPPSTKQVDVSLGDQILNFIFKCEPRTSVPFAGAGARPLTPRESVPTKRKSVPIHGRLTDNLC